MVMNLLNPDAFIARMNIKHFENDPTKLDIAYVRTLSDDALPVTLDLLLSRDDEGLMRQKMDAVQREITPWQSINLARVRAKDLMTAKLGSYLSL